MLENWSATGFISLTFPLIAINLIMHSPEMGLFGILSSKRNIKAM